MPGHSLRLIRGRWKVFHGVSFRDIQTNLQGLHDRFRNLGSKHRPRNFQVGGSGNDPDVKQVLLLEAGILEALQRWQTATPAAVYNPSELYDYDQMTELLNKLNSELAAHQNADDSYSGAYNEQPLPQTWQAHPDIVSAEYDNWVIARVEEFRDELTKKPKVKARPNPKRGKDALKYVGAILDQILQMLPANP